MAQNEVLRTMECNDTRCGASVGVVVVIIDGLSDVCLPVLSERSPLQMAKLPILDDLAGRGQCGLMDPVSPGLACGSDTAHMAIFGYEPRDCYRGRGAFEVIGDGLEILPGDIAFKCNFATIDEKSGIVLQRRVDRNFSSEASALCDLLDGIRLPSFPDIQITVKHAMKHRCGIRVRGPSLCDRVSGTDPLVDKQPLQTCTALDPSESLSLRTAAVVRELSDEMTRVLNGSEINRNRVSAGLPPANVVLLRGASEGIQIEPNFRTLHGLNAFLIAPTKIIAGIGRTVGIPIVDVEGATGDYYTNFQSKAISCVEKMLQKSACMSAGQGGWSYDLGIVHVKAVDDAGHDGDLERKVKHLEDVDKMVSTIVNSLAGSGRAHAGIIVTGDHTTPVSYMDHTCEPVPFIVAPVSTESTCKCLQAFGSDEVQAFNEVEIGMRGSLGRFPGVAIMSIVKSYLELMDVCD